LPITIENVRECASGKSRGKLTLEESMKIHIFVLLAILALSETVSYANASTVMGSISCKQWLARQKNPAEGEAYAIWLQGYLSGANAMYGEMLDRDFMKTTEKISVANWTDAYCQKYPESMLHDSTNALIKVLKRETPF
jgi:hypothetical protein